MRTSKTGGTPGHLKGYKQHIIIVVFHLQVAALKQAGNRQGTGQLPLQAPAHSALGRAEGYKARHSTLNNEPGWDNRIF